MLRICFCLLLSIFSISQSLFADTTTLSTITSKVTTSQLSNGVRVVWYQRPGSQVFSGAVVVRVGGIDEPQGYTGIAHLLEHMAFKGTSRIGTKDYAKEKVLLEVVESLETKKIHGTPLTKEDEEKLKETYDELNKIWIPDDFSVRLDSEGGVGTNATTAKELTKYFTSLPKDGFEFWASVESERLIDPVMRQFYKEKDVVLEERRMRFENSVEGKLYEKVIADAYTEHPYHQPVIGYETDLRRLTSDDLKKFHKKHYVPEKIVIGIVGDIDPQRGLPILERYFGKVEKSRAQQAIVPVEPPQDGEKIVTLEKGSNPFVFIAYHKPAYPNPADISITLAADILVGSQTSPMRKELVLKEKRALDISYFEAPGQIYPSLLFFSLTPSKGVTNDQLVKFFDESLAKSIENGFNEKLLAEAKKRISVGFLSSFKDSSGLAMNLATSELVYGSWKETLEWYQNVQVAKLEDVKAAAIKYFIKKERVIGKAEPVKSVEVK